MASFAFLKFLHLRVSRLALVCERGNLSPDTFPEAYALHTISVLRRNCLGWATSGVTSALGSGMVDEGEPNPSEATITLVHGRQRLQVPLPQTLGALKTVVEEETHIPSSEQMLITAGRKLYGEESSPLLGMGIKGGKKVLVMRNCSASGDDVAQEAEASLNSTHVREQKAALGHVEASLAKLRQAVEGLSPAQVSDEEKRKLRMDVLRAQEQCMRILEVLDSLSGPTGDWKNERKSTVRNVQKVLGECDVLAAVIQRKYA